MSELVLNNWLSDFLGKPAYQVHGTPSELSATHLPQGNTFIEARVSAQDAVGLLHLQQLGFHVIDCNLTLERRAKEVGAWSGFTHNVRFAREYDELSVCALAYEAFEYNRFHRDPAIPNAIASQIKEAWVTNFFRGKRGDWMVVVEGAEGVCGFLQLLKSDDNTVTIDLIAVAPHRRREGLALAMINFALHHCLDTPTTMRVGTQPANTASLRLYQSMGFQLYTVSFLLHRHG